MHMRELVFPIFVALFCLSGSWSQDLLFICNRLSSISLDIARDDMYSMIYHMLLNGVLPESMLLYVIAYYNVGFWLYTRPYDPENAETNGAN